jgi:hypothetical protein
MGKYISSVLLLLTMTSTAFTQIQTLSSGLFFQQENETEAYQCIQIRRGDIITLTGEIAFLNKDINENLIFTSLGGRIFLIKGELVSKLSEFIQRNNKIIIIKGKVIFEGLEDIPAEMEVISFEPSKNN